MLSGMWLWTVETRLGGRADWRREKREVESERECVGWSGVVGEDEDGSALSPVEEESPEPSVEAGASVGAPGADRAAVEVDASG
jgi:hypothetical protein